MEMEGNCWAAIPIRDIQTWMWSFSKRFDNPLCSCVALGYISPSIPFQKLNLPLICVSIKNLKCSPKPPSSSSLLSSPTPPPSLLRNVPWIALNILSWHSSSTPIGCWTDSADRTLRDNFLQSVDMSTEVCESFCKAYPIFGTENSMFLIWRIHEVRREVFWYLNSESMLLWKAIVWRRSIPGSQLGWMHPEMCWKWKSSLRRAMGIESLCSLSSLRGLGRWIGPWPWKWWNIGSNGFNIYLFFRCKINNSLRSSCSLECQPLSYRTYNISLNEVYGKMLKHPGVFADMWSGFLYLTETRRYWQVKDDLDYPPSTTGDLESFSCLKSGVTHSMAYPSC